MGFEGLKVSSAAFHWPRYCRWGTGWKGRGAMQSHNTQQAWTPHPRLKHTYPLSQLQRKRKATAMVWMAMAYETLSAPHHATTCTAQGRGEGKEMERISGCVVTTVSHHVCYCICYCSEVRVLHSVIENMRWRLNWSWVIPVQHEKSFFPSVFNCGWISLDTWKNCWIGLAASGLCKYWRQNRQDKDNWPGPC